MLYGNAGSRQVHLVSHFDFTEEQRDFENFPCPAAESYYVPAKSPGRLAKEI